MQRNTDLKQRGFSLIELIAVVIIIAILAVLFLRHADNVVEEAEQTALESIARSFASTMSSLRGQWIVENSQQSAAILPAMVMLDNQPVYLNEYRWPASTSAESSANSDSQTAQECRQLWQALIQNPTPATIDPRRRGEARLHISAPDGSRCRYELTSANPASHYFEYNLKTGRVDLHTPPLNPSDERK